MSLNTQIILGFLIFGIISAIFNSKILFVSLIWLPIFIISCNIHQIFNIHISQKWQDNILADIFLTLLFFLFTPLLLFPALSLVLFWPWWLVVFLDFVALFFVFKNLKK